ncbi:peptidoglycan-binding domain-containing protein [Glacieibacterium frigidum]|uniref:Peptidoglycan binding-like domain-containing protein n=1 Tax=Glacieibacterium frigidum TaxID=2593303 RepID=A0A552U8T8_9SPHN|nr:peptidoglycan-binding domain-containing protein [Glacieibacterium frigidum]TRW14632.1 hypothetical protein FMM06_13140 [Glacieibacterium frigidum]
MMLVARLRATLTLLSLGLFLSGCIFDGGERVNSTSPVIRTSMMPASVPYYLDPCGQNGDKAEYRLYPPAGLRKWMGGKDRASAEQGSVEELAASHERCTRQLRIGNGDAITVRLHRVGLGGLARFSRQDPRRCVGGCRRDIAIVMEFNGSTTLQRPIVAFYQTDVPPDGLLQFSNQTIFSQDEWFFRYPPNVRVRLYDVRDDKDAALRANLETVKRGANLIKSYISGAAIAGPIVDTAFKAADQLLSKPRNRAILDMSFQLFPQLEDQAVKNDSFPGKPCEAAVGKADISGLPITPAELARQQKLCVEQQRIEAEVKSAVPTTEAAVRQFQRANKVAVDGIIGPTTRKLLNSRGLRGSDDQLGEQIQKIQIAQRLEQLSPVRSSGVDATFGAPILASQYIVFSESAYGLSKPTNPSSTVQHPRGCSADGTGEDNRLDNRRRLIGAPLPKFYFVPDGVDYMGAKIHARFDDRSACVLETPFVVFAITRESSAVSLDVAQRISELGSKFSVTPTVSEGVISTLSATLVDAELALAIDRLENRRRGAEFYKMVETLDAQLRRATPPSPGDKTPPADTAQHPKPGADYRNRVYRLIADYTGCVVTDDSADTVLPLIRDQWHSSERLSAVRSSFVKPYFKDATACEAPVEKPKAPAIPAAEPETDAGTAVDQQLS